MLDLNQLTFVAFDTETTSLSPISGKLVELSGIKFNLEEREKIEVFDALINPGGPIPEEVIQVHGITDEMVKDKPKAAEVIPQFLKFIDGPQAILLAHNACFDMAFLGMELARLRIPDPGCKCMDTLILARNTYPELRRYDLPHLIRQLRIPQGKFHRALADSSSVKELFFKIVDKNKAKTLAELIRLTEIFKFSDASAFDVQPPLGFELFAQAIKKSQSIIMIYEGGTKGLQPRKITPLSLIKTYNRIYVLAYCHIDNTQKSFRLDRIKKFKLTS